MPVRLVFVGLATSLEMTLNSSPCLCFRSVGIKVYDYSPGPEDFDIVVVFLFWF